MINVLNGQDKNRLKSSKAQAGPHVSLRDLLSPKYKENETTGTGGRRSSNLYSEIGPTTKESVGMAHYSGRASGGNAAAAEPATIIANQSVESYRK